MSKLLFPFALIVFGLAIGYVAKMVYLKENAPLADRIAAMLRNIAVLYMIPVATACTLWSAHFRDSKIAAFPFFGSLTVLIGGAMGLAAASLLRLGPGKKGPMFLSGALSNFGGFGAFLSFVFWGEHGYALVLLYKLFDEIHLVFLGYPSAKYFSSKLGRESGSNGEAPRKGILNDPFLMVPLVSILVGFALNFSGIDRPDMFGHVNFILISLSTLLLLVVLGFGLSFRAIKSNVKECVYASIIKFITLPLAMGCILWALNFEHIDGGLPFKVAVLLSSMPVAFYSTIPPAIYGLDKDMAYSQWIVSTGLFLLFLPLYYLLFQ